MSDRVDHFELDTVTYRRLIIVTDTLLLVCFSGQLLMAEDKYLDGLMEYLFENRSRGRAFKR